MTNDLTYEDFVNLYYGYARDCAKIHLANIRKKKGDFDKNIDLDYVVDAATLTTMVKVYEKYDASKGASVKTFINTIVHNEVVNELDKETGGAAKKADLDDLKQSIKEMEQDDSQEARRSLIPKMMEVISKLSPDDQVILNFYLEDKSSYIEKSAEKLNISKNYVSVRRDRMFARLRELMDMTKGQYAEYVANYSKAGPFTTSVLIRGQERRQSHTLQYLTRNTSRTNPIMPSLTVSDLARKLVAELL